MEGWKLETWFPLARRVVGEGEGSLLMRCAKISFDIVTWLVQGDVPIS
jgi:hypothetical protein